MRKPPKKKPAIIAMKPTIPNNSQMVSKAALCSKIVRSPPQGVGTAGFEPATTRPPAECATRLRHVPTHTRNIPDAPHALPIPPPAGRASVFDGEDERLKGSSQGT